MHSNSFHSSERRPSDPAIQRLVADRREAEQRFQLMADHAPVMLWLSGTDANCYFFNQGWLRFTGRGMEQEVGIGWTEGVHPEDFERCMRVYMEAFVRREAFVMEYRLRRADARYRWVYDQGTPRFTVDGAFAGYVGSAFDVTEQLEARRALTVAAEAVRRSEAQLRHILDAAPDAIVAVNAAGVVQAVNPAGSGMFGATVAEMVGTDVALWIQGRGTSRSCLTPGDVEQVVCVRADGTTFPGEASSSHSSEYGLETVLIVRDSSALRHLEREILETGEAVRRKFGRDLHDDLGQLLTGIAFLAQGLAQDAPADVAPRAARLVSLVNDAMKRAHQIAEGLAPEMAAGRLLGDRLEELARSTAETFGVECAFHGEELAEPEADERLQAFLIAQEAVTNAVRHSQGKRVQIALRYDGPRRSLTVRDDGIGLRAPARPESLGLRNMEYRARMLGGQLEVRPAEGTGTEVRCTW